MNPVRRVVVGSNLSKICRQLFPISKGESETVDGPLPIATNPTSSSLLSEVNEHSTVEEVAERSSDGPENSPCCVVEENGKFFCP